MPLRLDSAVWGRSGLIMRVQHRLQVKTSGIDGAFVDHDSVDCILYHVRAFAKRILFFEGQQFLRRLIACARSRKESDSADMSPRRQA